MTEPQTGVTARHGLMFWVWTTLSCAVAGAAALLFGLLTLGYVVFNFWGNRAYAALLVVCASGFLLARRGWRPLISSRENLTAPLSDTAGAQWLRVVGLTIAMCSGVFVALCGLLLLIVYIATIADWARGYGWYPH